MESGTFWLNFILFLTVGIAMALLYLWFGFVAFMTLYQKARRGDLSLIGWIPMILIFVIAGPLDVFIQIFPATVYFLDWPREWTLSGRMERYIKTLPVTDWRYRFSIKMEKQINAHDPGHLR